MRATVFFSLLLGVAGVACSPANVNDPEYWEPSLTTASAGDPTDPAADDAGTTTDDAGTTTTTDGGTTKPPASNSCALHLEFTTHSYGGRYAPSHVLAVWIVDAAGKFIRTLDLWGYRRTGNLYEWRVDSKNNTVDAITAATLKSHGTLKADWDCLDAAKNRVSPGNYQVWVEFTESNVSSASNEGPHFSVPFEVGGKPLDLTAPDDKAYTGKIVKFTP